MNTLGYIKRSADGVLYEDKGDITLDEVIQLSGKKTGQANFSSPFFQITKAQVNWGSLFSHNIQLILRCHRDLHKKGYVFRNVSLTGSKQNSFPNKIGWHLEERPQKLI